MPPLLRSPSGLPCSSCLMQLGRTAPSTMIRSFSSTQPLDNKRRPSRARRQMLGWMARQGNNFYDPIGYTTNYLGAYMPNGLMRRVVDQSRKLERDKTKLKERLEEEKDDKSRAKLMADLARVEKRIEASKGQVPPAKDEDNKPFPSNPLFSSQAILTDIMKDMIFKEMEEGINMRDISRRYQIDLRRVAAVYRLKLVEMEWKRDGKELADGYHETVMGMVPITPAPVIHPDGAMGDITPHEPINDLPILKKTGQQMFLPVSESRQFTRADAAKAFHPMMLPADKRVPHPNLAVWERQKLDGLLPHEREASYKAFLNKEEDRLARAMRKQLIDKNSPGVRIVQTPRSKFRFYEISVETAGKDGRGMKGVGWRYGMPFMDRKRGDLKIPGRV